MPFLKNYKVPRSCVLNELTKKNGLRHAIFTIVGDKYIGQWKNNLKHGKGSHLSKHKQLYEGDWLNGKKHGYGVLSRVEEDGSYTLLYEGDWLNGTPEGFGRKHSSNEEFYEGMVKGGKRHGQGHMWYADGSFYDGQWANDMKDGLGLFSSANGNRYEGHWRADKKHGYGQLYHLSHGQCQSGLWNQGVAICTNMTDITYRQACTQPTPYPIPKIGLQEPEKVYQLEYDRIAAEQKEPELQLQTIQSASPKPRSRPTLSPWFYVDCCKKTFPNRL